MNKKPKFKVGDVVECVEGGKEGRGWKLGHQFTIVSVDNYSDTPVYWKGFNNNGVYEDSLKLVNKEEIIYM